MVNHGISRACLTCKTRRIKCDERKPACERCIKSRRTCLGYNDDKDVFFRDCGPNPIIPYSLPSSTCSQSCPRPLELSSNLRWTQPDLGYSQALKTFFFDYVLVSKDPSLSRGYFDGLESLLNRTGPNSELANAIELVALASEAARSGSFDHSSNNTRYLLALSAFQKTMDDTQKRNADEALMTAALLGLYEMITATEAYPNAHNTHLKGVSAILCTRNLPFDLLALAGSDLFELFNPLVPRRPAILGRAPGLLSPYPCLESDPPTRSLDVLLIKLRPVRERASELLSDPEASRVDLRMLKREATLLNKEFSLWPLCQPKEWMPKTHGIVKEMAPATDDSLCSMSFWPGKVDTYFDLYVAAVWNIYRKARLKLIDVILESSSRLQVSRSLYDEPPAIRKLKSEMQELVNELCASIPYHLISDLRASLETGRASRADTPGKALGGLLLMYPLYIASCMPNVPTKQRIWMRGRLHWIGNNMGIRQATMLANVRFELLHCRVTDLLTVLQNDLLVSYKSIADGHVLVFAGALLKPVGEQPEPHRLSDK